MECLASQRYPEKPLRFFLENDSHTVEKIKSEGRTPQGYTFTIEDQNEETFLLLYDDIKTKWMVKAWK